MKKTFVSVHPAFLLLILIGFFTKTLFMMLAVYFCLCLHELGHAVAAYSFGVRILYIKIMPFGIAMRLSGEHAVSDKKKFVISASGPLVSVITGIFWGNCFLGNVNLSLGIFNLLPVVALDGGRMFFIAVSSCFGSIKGYNITKTVSKIFAVLIFLLGSAVLYVTKFNVSFVMVAVFLIYSLVCDSGYGKLAAIQNVLDYKQKKSKCGVYKTKSISISAYTPFRKILKHIPNSGICIIHILGEKQNLIASISERDAIDVMLKYGAGISYSDIKDRRLGYESG